jgi:hypothetical protein
MLTATMNDTLESIKSRWASFGISIPPGLDDGQLRAFESRHRVQLPEAMRSFYRLMDGMPAGCMDEAAIAIWPLSQVASVPEKLTSFRGIPDYGCIEDTLLDASSWFAFADHSVWLQVYAIQLSATEARESPIISICGTEWQTAASSFKEWLRRYASDPWSVV